MRLPPPPAASPEVLLVGGGHSMLAVLAGAREWAASGARVTLLSDRPFLLYSGMVPEWLGGVYRTGDLRIDLERLCREAGVRFVQGSAAGLQVGERAVVTDRGDLLRGDLVALDVGAVNPRAEEAGLAVPTKPLYHLDAVAGWLEEQARPGAAGNLVVVGGGAAGCEIALNASARLRCGGSGATVTLLEPSGRLVPQFPAGLAGRVLARLRERGVRVLLRATAARVEEGSVRLASGGRLEADLVVWATGSVGPSWFAASGLPVDERGLLKVDRGLRCRAAPWLLAAGDCASVAGLEHLARSGVHAVRAGPALRENLGRLLAAWTRGEDLGGVPLAPFRPYPLAPYILASGEDDAYWTAGPLWWRGRAALSLKHHLDRRFVRSYQP